MNVKAIELCVAVLSRFQLGHFTEGSVSMMKRLKFKKHLSLQQKKDYANVQVQWMVQCCSSGWHSMDYIKRNAKAILNVEAIHSNMDQSGVFGT